MEGEKQNYNASDFFVTYSTSLNIAEVLTFYKTEMPNQGWTKIERRQRRDGPIGDLETMISPTGKQASSSLPAHPAGDNCSHHQPK